MIHLSPPLRRLEPRDADIVARLNDMASHGLVLTVWEGMREAGESVWDVGRRRTLARMQRPELEMVVIDRGQGAEAVMMGNPLPEAPQETDGVPEVFRVLVEMENLAPGSWYLNVLATLPEVRGQGHGGRLIACAEAFARAGGHRTLSLIASEANPAGLRLYRRHGFAEAARRPMVKGTWDGPGREWILFLKDL